MYDFVSDSCAVIGMMTCSRPSFFSNCAQARWLVFALFSAYILLMLTPWHVRRFGVIRAQRSPSVLWSIGFDGFRASCHWHIVSGIQMQDLWFLDVLKMIRAKLRTKWTTGGTVDDDDDWQIALFLTSLSFGLIYVDCYIHFWHDRLLPITIFFLSLFLSLSFSLSPRH